MKSKDTMNGRKLQKMWNLTGKSHNLQHIAYYNSGYLSDAENFNLYVVNEKIEGNYSNKRRFILWLDKIMCHLLYRLSLIIFFSIY